jgi:protein disulfide-isomerase-like protein
MSKISKVLSSDMSGNPLFIMLMFVLVIIIFLAIFRSVSPFLTMGIGLNAHIGSLKGSFQIEAFENQAGTKPCFVLFYAPWCGHCKTAKPIFEEFKESYNGPVEIIAIDCDENKEIAKKYGIQGFPTFKYFPNGLEGASQDYNGERTADDFKEFLSDKTGSMPEHFTNIEGVIEADPDDDNSSSYEVMNNANNVINYNNKKFFKKLMKNPNYFPGNGINKMINKRGRVRSMQGSHVNRPGTDALDLGYDSDSDSNSNSDSNFKGVDGDGVRKMLGADGAGIRTMYKMDANDLGLPRNVRNFKGFNGAGVRRMPGADGTGVRRMPGADGTGVRRMPEMDSTDIDQDSSNLNFKGVNGAGVRRMPEVDEKPTRYLRGYDDSDINDMMPARDTGVKQMRGAVPTLLRNNY